MEASKIVRWRLVRVPIGGEAADHFCADELLVSTTSFRAAPGELTGRPAAAVGITF